MFVFCFSVYMPYRNICSETQMFTYYHSCVCCSLRQDLIDEVLSLSKSGKFDSILIESSGISEPIHIAETFMHADRLEGVMLGDYAKLV